MTTILPIVAAALLLCSASGLVVLVWLPRRWRRLLLPALPLLGATALVVGLHATSLLMGVHAGLPLLIVVGAAAVVARSIREHWWGDLGEWPWLVAGLAAGAVFLLLALGPARAVGGLPATTTGNNDAFAYISNSAWLVDHPLTQLPSPSSDPPAYGYARLTLFGGYRVGEELDQAAVATVMRRDPLQTWYATVAVWLMVLPGAMIVTAALLNLRRSIGLIAGAMACASSIVLTQVVHSNSASMLGLAMAPVALALITRHLEDAAQGVSGRVPVWLAAGSLTALAGTYTEYLPLVALGLAAYVLVRRTAHMVTIVSGLRLAALALVIAPWIWFRAAKSLLFTTSITGAEAFTSPFLGPPVQATSHYVGTLALFEQGGHRSSYLLFALGGAGVLAAMILSPARRFFATILGSIALVVILLSTVHRFPYGQGRAVEVTAPLFLLAGVAGYFALAGRLSELQRHWTVYPMATGALALAAVFITVNYVTISPYLRPPPNQKPAAHFYDASQFDAAHAWLAAVSGPQGVDGMVIDTQVWDGVWLQYRFRDMPKVSFPFVTLGYNDGGPSTEYFDGRGRRYAVIENGLFMSAGPGVVVGGAGDFTFLDLQRGQVVMAAGTNQFISLEPGPSRQWMSDDGDVLVVHDATVRRVALALIAPPGRPPVVIDVSVPGVAVQTSVVSAERTDVIVDLPAGTAALLHLHNTPRASVSRPDPRLRSIALVGIRIAG